MEENKNKKFEEIDELLTNTSAENRLQFNLSDIDAVEPEAPVAQTVEAVPVADEPEVLTEQPGGPEDEDGGICIIDETSTHIILEEGPELDMSETSAPSKAKKEKVKFKPLQIVLIVVAALITLWTLVFTVDHTLAAQGLTPVFSFQTEEYADGSVSYVGAGYKVQFMFDANGSLTQDCVPFWKDGPNDVRQAKQLENAATAVQ